MNAPRNWPAIKVGTSPHSTPRSAAARPIVTAGLMWPTPSVTAMLARTPTNTAIAHAHVMTTHPLF